MKSFIVIFLIIFSINQTYAQEKLIHAIQPDHAKIQFAGNIGVLSAGIGYNLFSGKIQSDLLYGFVPASIGGTEIHCIANKNNFKVFQYPVAKDISLIHSVGFSLNYYITNNTFLFLPKQYPDKYYSPNAVHFAPLFSYNFLYSNESLKLFKNINIYFEISSLDNYLWYYLKSPEFNFSEIWNLAIGTSIQLYKRYRQ